nr:MAG TPA: hypothetical protein [Caudoviricetes sp.]
MNISFIVLNSSSFFCISFCASSMLSACINFISFLGLSLSSPKRVLLKSF